MKIYKPSVILLIIDIISILAVLGIVLGWLPLTTQIPFIKYNKFLLLFAGLWIILSYIYGRYRKKQNYFKLTVKLFYVAISTYLILRLIILFYFDGVFSEQVLLAISVGVYTFIYCVLLFYHAYRYAVVYEIPEGVMVDIPREHAELIPAEAIDEDAYQTLCEEIKNYSGKKVLNFLQQTVDLKSGNIRILPNNDTHEINSIINYRYSSFILLKKLNNVRKINVLLYQLNGKLPDGGLFICCFESKSTRKKGILKKYPKVLNYAVYSVDFLVKRVMPRIFITRRLYYDITHGENRIFSKAEVLGRLYCSGFEVVGEKKIGELNYVVARRFTQPQPLQNRTYGPLISLPRIGKNGKRFKVYKMRTMHPYSEYMQPYIYEKNKLSEGGKIRNDIRITTLGRFMRKYWLDELPMLINMLKGEMKLVGVRPLSQHYFNLYSPDLQDMRIKFKPGLLPPFYADMPKTLDEIQASEMHYLNACVAHGTFVTDVRYLFKILNNILFKKARSA